MTMIKLRKIILLWGFILFLLATTYARPNSKICRNNNGKFPRPGTSCRGYYECKNYVPVEKTCADGENFNANKGRCDWEDLYPCLEKQKDKECPKENGLFLKPRTYCKKYYRCCNGKAKEESCSADLLFDPSKGKCEWPDLYTCIESLSTTEKVSSTVTKFGTSIPPLETSTDPAISKSTIQKMTSKIFTSSSTTEISTTLKPKKVSTSEIPTTQSTITEISTSQKPTTREISSKPTTTEISTTQPTVTEISTSESTMSEISTSQPTTIEISTSQSTITKIPTTQSMASEISTLQPTTTEISTITKMSTLQSTTEISTSRRAGESTTLLPTTIEISTISQTTSPQVSFTHSTDHTILKENKEGELTESPIFEKTKEVTYSPSTVEVTTSAEVNIMCPEPNGYFPHPTDKHKFVGCVGNIPNVLTCPSDLVYKHHLKRCDHE